MNRAKEYLTLVPFAALAFAVAYLQGYWGHFEIVAFPYLGLQELIAYSSVPFFGFLLFGLIGGFFGYLHGGASSSSKESGRQTPGSMTFRVTIFTLLLLTVITLFALDVSEKWLLAPPLFFVSILTLLKPEYLIDLVGKQLAISIVIAFVILGMLATTFGYGRAEALRLASSSDSNAKLTLESGLQIGKLIGKLGNYYFVIDPQNNILQLPESSIKRIEHIKKHG